MPHEPADPQQRHHRQTRLAVWSEASQRRVSVSSVLVVGVGATGSASAELLARAGVGRIVLVDRDIVELTNLQRQTLYAEADLERPKVQAGADRLRAIDRGLAIEPVAEHLDGELAAELVRDADLVIDGTDNFETRYVLNDAAVAFGKTLVYGGAVGTRGTVMPIVPGRGPCLRCVSDLAPSTQETCDTTGVLGPAVAWVSARQAAIALRALAEGDRGLPIRLESFDAWDGVGRSISMEAARDPDCACCARREFAWLDGIAGSRAVTLCGRNSVQVMTGGRQRIALGAIARRLRPLGTVESTDDLLTGTVATDRGEIGLTVFADGRAIIEGTSDPAVAQALYDRYIGR